MPSRFVVALAALLAPVVHAAQVTLTEVTYTHSSTTTTDSHYRVMPLPGSPGNWVSPVDYTQGTAVVRLEVFSKPSTAATRFQICFEATPSYACTDQAPAYTTPGVYTWTTRFVNFYQYNQVDWTKGTRNIALILKDTNNVKPAPENVGATESARYMPTNLRVTVTLVSNGATYQPPDAGFDAGPPTAVDAGAPDAGRPDSGNGVDAGHDAGSAFDAGQQLPTDAGGVDAGPGAPGVDAGTTGPGDVAGGCGCGAAPGSMLAAAFALALRRRARRSSQR